VRIPTVRRGRGERGTLNRILDRTKGEVRGGRVVGSDENMNEREEGSEE
jgi:hypothetical protein